MGLKTVDIGHDENLDAAMESEWGKSFFHCKTKPTSAALKDRVEGKIRQRIEGSRKMNIFWVVRKPNRQQGAKPKKDCTVTLPEDLLKELDDLAESARDYRSTLVEAALRAYIPTKRAELGL